MKLRWKKSKEKQLKNRTRGKRRTRGMIGDDKRKIEKLHIYS